MNSNVIELAEQPGTKVAEILRLSIANKLGVSPDDLFEACLKLTGDLMAKLADGYVIYQYNGLRRAALVINMEFEGYCFPFVFHKDDGNASPVGLLYADVHYSHLGSLQDYICCDDEHVHLYHAIADFIPLSLNGIGIIQAMENAKQAGVSNRDDLGLRRVAKATVAQLAE
jgi:hypothetical protein